MELLLRVLPLRLSEQPLVCNPSRLCASWLQKHLCVLVLHLLSFLSLSPMLKVMTPPWSRETKKLWAGCAQQVVCPCCWGGGQVWELRPGCGCGTGHWCVPGCRMKFWPMSAKCARLQHLQLSLWLCSVPDLSSYTLWVWSLAKLQGHLPVPAKLTIQGRRQKPGSSRVFLSPCPLM